VQTPPPPSQQQAEEAQQSRYAAERAILSLFSSPGVRNGTGGSGENESSSLHAVRIIAILAALSGDVKRVSFRHPRNRYKSLLLSDISNDEVSKAVLGDAQRAFNGLAASELSDEQAAVLWSTWAHSRVSDEIAQIVNGGKVEHEFSGSNRVLRKVWISRSDRKVRPLHAKLHGKTISTTEDFWRWPHTSQRLRWPGDKEAPLDATAGCRCVCLLTWANQDEVSSTIRRIVEHTKP
jgi:hypothetical protein